MDRPSPTSLAGESATSMLPLVPFERYMLVDDRPAYAMSFILAVELGGVPDRPAMEAAALEAMKRHPLLSAKLVRKGFREAWLLADEPSTAIRWCGNLAEAEDCMEEPLDLKRAEAFRLAIAHEAGGTVMQFLFHHAVCDGIGGLRFVGDLLALYGRQVADGPDRPTLLPIDPETLRHRGRFDVRLPAPVTRWQAMCGMAREAWKVASRRPRPLCVARRARERSRRPVARMPVISLPQCTAGDYRSRATELGVTVNDLLLRDMFLAIRQWNSQQGCGSGPRWLRITVPTNLRYRHESRLPASNLLGYALVSRREMQCDESPEFLAGLAADMDATRKWGLGSLFVQAIALIDRVPGLLWLSTRLGRCFSTLVLSNVGNPVRRFRARFPLVDGKVRAGNLTLERICGTPPIRPGTRVAVAVADNAGDLTVCIRYDTRWLTEADAVEFLALYRRQLERSAGGTD